MNPFPLLWNVGPSVLQAIMGRRLALNYHNTLDSLKQYQLIVQFRKTRLIEGHLILHSVLSLVTSDVNEWKCIRSLTKQDKHFQKDFIFIKHNNNYIYLSQVQMKEIPSFYFFRYNAPIEFVSTLFFIMLLLLLLLINLLFIKQLENTLFLALILISVSNNNDPKKI